MTIRYLIKKFWFDIMLGLTMGLLLIGIAATILVATGTTFTIWSMSWHP